MHYLSFWTYSYRGAAINMYKGLEFDCSPSELIPPTYAPGFTDPLPGGFNGQQICPITSGEQLLDRYDLNDAESDKWVHLAILVIFYLALNVIGAWVSVVVQWTKPTVEQWMMSDRTDSEASKTGTLHPLADKHGVELRFSNLCYDVNVKGADGKSTKLRLLNGVNGIVKPGRLTALVGSSGAGKSTLLDVLAGRKTGGETSGSILFNGQERDKYFSRWSGYVEQFDSHEPTQTVREAVEYSALLRLGGVPKDHLQKTVDHTLRLLDLDEYANIQIGDPLSGGLSPELRKKITIAVEYVKDPSLLFLDEPTTGLDAQSAANVAMLARRLANHSTVLCTIHQPSQEVVSLFDDVIVLQSGGKVVYHGPVNGLPTYFREQGLASFSPDCNVVDRALETVEKLSGDRGIDEAAPSDVVDIDLEQNEAGVDLHHAFSTSPLGVYLHDELAKPAVVAPFPQFHSSVAASFASQFFVLLRRFINSHMRSRVNTAARTLPFLFLGVFSGTLFWQLKQDQVGSFNRVPFVILSVMFCVFVAQTTIYLVVSGRETYYRESSSRMYRPLAFYLAEMVGDFPVVVGGSLLFSLTSYWLAGFKNDGDNFLKYILIIVIASLLGNAWATLVARLAPNAEFGTLIFTVPLVTFIAFAGFLGRNLFIFKGNHLPSISPSVCVLHVHRVVVLPLFACITLYFFSTNSHTSFILPNTQSILMQSLQYGRCSTTTTSFGTPSRSSFRENCKTWISTAQPTSWSTSLEVTPAALDSLYRTKAASLPSVLFLVATPTCKHLILNHPILPCSSGSTLPSLWESVWRATTRSVISTTSNVKKSTTHWCSWFMLMCQCAQHPFSGQLWSLRVTALAALRYSMQILTLPKSLVPSSFE